MGWWLFRFIGLSFGSFTAIGYFFLVTVFSCCCCSCFLNGKTHKWKQESSTFRVNLVNLSPLPKKKVSIILKDSHS